jgi:hypothetical protein
MLWKFLTAFVLMAICVAIHAAGITWPMRRLNRQLVVAPVFLAWTRRFIRLAGWIILLHLLEITVWGAFYVWQQAIPSPEDAWYFSAVTYTTTGYGDIVLPGPWRPFAAVEALTGILMCGWSTGFFFAVIHRIYEADRRMT